MQKTTIAGYPRIGNERQLKKSTEAYFKGKISVNELETAAKQIRQKQWLFLKDSGVSIIPSGDFSFYDLVLDTAFMLNVIPREHKALGLGSLDTLFACARGYQGENGDAKALSMRKWFTTNYHYIVPRIDSDTQIKLTGKKPFDMYLEALNLGIETKPVILGPFSFLKLSEVDGGRKKHIGPLIEAYKEIFSEFDKLSANWLQLDEPFLVSDLTKEDINCFKEIYNSILPERKNVKILLQTYFGDIRDIFGDIANMDFDGLGLDFIEGGQNLSLIKQYGFSKNTCLFAGVINGRNIWRNNYENTLNLLSELSKDISKDKIVISTSCSLLHVPYSLEYENKLSEEAKKQFAFAREKVQELNELAQLFDDAEYKKNPIFIINQKLHQKTSKAVSENTTADFTRRPDFRQREEIQKKALNLPCLPLTTVGSFPQTKEIKSLRRKFKKGEITQSKYEEQIKGHITKCIAFQEEADIDVLVHGEFERNDMVEYFGENLEGFLFTQNGWVQSYGTRCVKPPIIYSDVKRKKPITIEYITYAQSLTDKPVKGMLTGPVTILNWSFPREDISKREIAFQIAGAIKQEVMNLEAAGIKIIQIDEAALKEKLPIRKTNWHEQYLDWAIPAFRAVHCDVKPETQIHTHMCYSEFEDILNEIQNMDADVISFEAARSNLSILSAIRNCGFNTQVGPGVYDIHSPRVPETAEIASVIEKMLEFIPKEKLWINPDCGLKTRGEPETKKSIINMVSATKTIRSK